MMRRCDLYIGSICHSSYTNSRVQPQLGDATRITWITKFIGEIALTISLESTKIKTESWRICDCLFSLSVIVTQIEILYSTSRRVLQHAQHTQKALLSSALLRTVHTLFPELPFSPWYNSIQLDQNHSIWFSLPIKLSKLKKMSASFKCQEMSPKLEKIFVCM